MGAIRVNDSNPFLFQVHFKWVHDLLPLATQVSIPPFEQLSKKGVDCLQVNILKRMHEHSFSNIISKLSSNYHHAWLRSCVGLSLGVWLYAPNHPIFKDGLWHFLLTITHQIGPLPFHGSWSFSMHIWPCHRSNTNFVVFMERKHMITHDAIWNFFTSIARDVKVHVLHEQTHVFPMPSF